MKKKRLMLFIYFTWFICKQSGSTGEDEKVHEVSPITKGGDGDADGVVNEASLAAAATGLVTTTIGTALLLLPLPLHSLLPLSLLPWLNKVKFEFEEDNDDDDDDGGGGGGEGRGGDDDDKNFDEDDNTIVVVVEDDDVILSIVEDGCEEEEEGCDRGGGGEDDEDTPVFW